MKPYLNQLARYLDQQKSGLQALIYSAWATMACVGAAILGSLIILAIGVSTDSREKDIQPLVDHARENYLGALFVILIVVVVEETAFRLLPFWFARKFGANQHQIIWVGVASSAAFGLYHGGVVYLLIQGVYGLFFCVVFLKCGGWYEYWGRAFLASCSSHFLLDAGLITLTALS